MRAAAIIVGFFAAGWGVAAVWFGLGLSWLMAAPLLVSAGLIGAAWRQPPAPLGADESRRVGQLVMWASAAEGIGILVAINLVTWAGHREWQLAAFAGVVGLHFLPLARWLPLPSYYLSGFALVALAAGCALFLPASARDTAICAGSAMILWLTLWGRIRAARRHAGATQNP